MRIATVIAGVFCLSVVLFDAFQTIIVPRRAMGKLRLTNLFYGLTWRPWIYFAKLVRQPNKRESVLSYYGPMSLILLLMVWAAGLVVGFGLLYSSLGRPFHDGLESSVIRTDLYVSGTTLFTLGLGDVTPQTSVARVLTILEAGTGLGFLAVIMGYFPVLYSAF
jgi:hypothetical protein